MEIVVLAIPKDEKSVTFTYNGKDIYGFTLDTDLYDEMIEWLFDNTKDRFTFLGTNRVYFENSLDAVAFKLRWL